MRLIRKIFGLTYYQLLIGLRIKQAFFFSIVFPLFTFILFNFIWNTQKDKEVTLFFLTGILGAACVAEGVYSLSTVFKKYAVSGFLTYLQKMFHIQTVIVYFIALILSRLIVFLWVTLLMLGLSFFLFGMDYDSSLLLRMLIGIPLAIFIFSFLGLIFSFTGIKNVDTSANHIIFYLVVFSSNAYYTASQGNAFIGFLGDFFPLNHILVFLRLGGEFTHFTPLILWTLIPPIIFYILLYRIKIKKGNNL